MQFPLPRRHPAGLDAAAVDRAVAVALTGFAQLEVWLGSVASQRLPAALLIAPVTIGVAVRRRRPATVGIGAALVSAVLSGGWTSPQSIGDGIAYFCCLYGLTVWTPPRRFAGGLAVVVAADLLSVAGPAGSLRGTVPFTAVTAVVMLLVRRIVGDRERRLRLAERERDVAAREAIVEERARIARELHDVIAHHVSMIVMQAGAERRVAERGGDVSVGVLGTIEQVGRGALTEMRRLLAMLRDGQSESLTPQPRLADVPLLVERMRESGLPVELRIEGEPRDLPVGIELSAYRIVQEALTNALKHAGDARATVAVRYRPGALELEIADDGGAEAPAPSGGHGLVGMRERVALYGGRLQTGARPGGGYAVRALLPVP
jgi:signal transduction histidine kinase